MRKALCIYLILCICALLCACQKAQTAPAEIPVIPKMPVAETIEETVIAETAEATTEEPTTAVTSATEPPREIGPSRIDGNAVTLENVYVEYTNQLPQHIKSSTTYSIWGNRDEFDLNDSQVYAEVHFTVTNKTGDAMEIADIHDDFFVELIYDSRFVYSPENDIWCYFKAGAQDAAVSARSSIGAVKLPPLATEDVIVYMPCAKELSTELDKPLSVVFTSNYSGYENFEFVIR